MVSPTSFVPQGVQVETHFIPDFTGSNTQPVDESRPNGMKKTEFVNLLTKALVDQLANPDAIRLIDAEAADEPVEDPAAGPNEIAGGLRVYGFADGRVFPYEDLNTTNFARKWHPHFGGLTYMSPALLASQAAYDAEAKEKNWYERPVALQPILFDIVATDGQMSDHDDVHTILASASQRRRFAVICYGSGREHNASVAEWLRIEKGDPARNIPPNPFVHVIVATARTDAQGIAQEVLSLIQ